MREEDDGHSAGADLLPQNVAADARAGSEAT
jgi:hypothetical protein